jgi:hypothetical protein
MSLIQLPKVIELVNTLSFKVNELEQKIQKLEIQVQLLLGEHNKFTVIQEPIVNKKPTLKKND